MQGSLESCFLFLGISTKQCFQSFCQKHLCFLFTVSAWCWSEKRKRESVKVRMRYFQGGILRSHCSPPELEISWKWTEKWHVWSAFLSHFDQISERYISMSNYSRLMLPWIWFGREFMLWKGILCRHDWKTTQNMQNMDNVPYYSLLPPKASAEGACILSKIGYYGACMMGYYGACMMGYYDCAWRVTMDKYMIGYCG